MLSQLGLAAGAAGWKAGHEAVRSGALRLDVTAVDEDALKRCIAQYAAEPARAYMRQSVGERDLTPAEGVRLFSVYLHTFIRGALDQALDGGALFRGR